MDLAHVNWPFFDDRHRAFASELDGWAKQNLAAVDRSDVDIACRALVAALGGDGWLRTCVPAAYGGTSEHLDARTICLTRETLAYHDALADFAFAMQGLGSAPIALGGSSAIAAQYLSRVVRGEAIAALAISEADAGSDVAAVATRATRDGDAWLLDGEKTWISNGGIASFYVVLARSGEAAGSRGLSAFVLDAGTPGLDATERITTIAPHPMATLRLRGCRVPGTHLLGTPGEGFKLVMRTLDIFRPSVAAAALGMARRALDEALAHVTARRMFGQTLADFQLTQAAIADMATGIDAGALLAYRAAWTHDVTGAPATREAAMAKLAATETAQRVIDRAVQLFGARGVTAGNIAERLYREIRSLRIYEGASEVQQLIVARETLAAQKRTGGG
jgi:acyl-CoA dehydrogenase